MTPGSRRSLGPAAAALCVAAVIAAAVVVASNDGGARGQGQRGLPDAPNAPNIETEAEGGGGALAEAPNIVFVLTDDQSIDSFTPASMPETHAKVMRAGTRFPDAIAAPPLCCPYRAGFLTGQYPHNNGVIANKPGYEDLRAPEHTMGAWLRERGYHTAMVGKYLNNIEDLPGAVVAPGWDEWLSAWFGSGMQNPEMNEGGEIVRKRGYLTDILTDRALEIIDEQTRRETPFFIWLAELAPHTIPAGPRPNRSCPKGLPQPTQADFDEYAGPRFSVIRSKPSFNRNDVSGVKSRPRLDREDVRDLRLYWRCEVTSLAAVDRGVGRIVDKLEQIGELDNTILIFGSDNGFMHGEHRDPKGKSDIYDEQQRVPFTMRVPASVLGGAARPVVRRTVTQLDLTATLLDLIGADPCLEDRGCRRLDGRSFAPLLRGADPRWARKRKVLYELGNGCTQIGVRTKRYSYSQKEPDCGGGKVRLYDRVRDPFERRNIAKREPRVVKRLRHTTVRLVRCSGVSGRDEKQPGSPFCR